MFQIGMTIIMCIHVLNNLFVFKQTQLQKYHSEYPLFTFQYKDSLFLNKTLLQISFRMHLCLPFNIKTLCFFKTKRNYKYHSKYPLFTFQYKDSLFF